jgi:hypothetical protein
MLQGFGQDKTFTALSEDAGSPKNMEITPLQGRTSAEPSPSSLFHASSLVLAPQLVPNPRGVAPSKLGGASLPLLSLEAGEPQDRSSRQYRCQGRRAEWQRERDCFK